MTDKELVDRTRETAHKLFSGPVPVEVPYRLWKAFDPALARELSLFITGRLYARTVLPLPERQLVAVSALAALDKTEELKIHLHGALNVGVAREKIVEAIFQVGVYAGFPAVNAALGALREVLVSRGEWPPADSAAPGEAREDGSGEWRGGRIANGHGAGSGRGGAPCPTKNGCLVYFLSNSLTIQVRKVRASGPPPQQIGTCDGWGRG